MEGYRVVKLDSVVHEIDLFITATGNKNIVMASQMTKMKNNAIICNIGTIFDYIPNKSRSFWQWNRHGWPLESTRRPEINYQRHGRKMAVLERQRHNHSRRRQIDESWVCHRTPQFCHEQQFHQPSDGPDRAVVKHRQIRDQGLQTQSWVGRESSQTPPPSPGGRTHPSRWGTGQIHQCQTRGPL